MNTPNIRFYKKRRSVNIEVEEIRSNLTNLAVDKNVAASTQNVAFNDLLCKQVLGVELQAIEGATGRELLAP